MITRSFSNNFGGLTTNNFGFQQVYGLKIQKIQKKKVLPTTVIQMLRQKAVLPSKLAGKVGATKAGTAATAGASKAAGMLATMKAGMTAMAAKMGGMGFLVKGVAVAGVCGGTVSYCLFHKYEDSELKRLEQSDEEQAGMTF